MINYKVQPEVFNLSCIKPIIKDDKKPTDDINNIRPLAVSDCIANLFELVLLNGFQANHIDSPKQFGF